ncbi:MAG: pentapeptide repeat-containing protein [Cyanobacteria bacterium J06649_4]
MQHISTTPLSADTLQQAYQANQRDFASANLTDMDLQHADLKGCDLSYADLTNANLSHTNLRGVDLSYACLHKANLTQCDLRGAMLIGTDLRDAVLTGAMLQEADYSLTETHFPSEFDIAAAKMCAIRVDSRRITNRKSAR